MKHWPKIAAFRNVVKHVKQITKHHARATDTPVEFPTLLFRGTVKLHGTNASIRRSQGQYIAQSRDRILTIDRDNFGFATWLRTSLLDPTFRQDLDNMFNRICHDPNSSVTVYGEWVGSNIQKNVALNQLDQPHFFIFGAHIEHEIFLTQEDTGKDIVEYHEYFIPNTMSINMPNIDRVHNILEYSTFFISIDFNDPEKILETITNLTLNIENECPVAKQLGFIGIGEGIVWSCVEQPENFDLMFKSKGSKHSGKSETTKKIVTIAPEQLSNYDQLLDHIVSVERLTQGLQEVPSISKENIGVYIKWVNQDILKEEMDTILLSGFTWSQIVGGITDRSRMHFLSLIGL